jgi:hypothetical protein
MLATYPDTGWTAAFDASGHEYDQPVVVVAGFVSSAKDWIDFEQAWKQRLAVDHLPYFRMVEFAQSSNAFRSFKGNEVRRRSLLADLMEIIKKHVYRKFAHGVAVQDFPVGLSDAFRRQLYFEKVYSFLGRTVAGEVSLWRIQERIQGPIRLVFEQGDFGNTDLAKRLVADGYPSPDFRIGKDKEGETTLGLEPTYVPLQAADFLAYEFFQKVKRYELGIEDTRLWAWQEFERIPGEVGTWPKENLAQLEGFVRLWNE